MTVFTETREVVCHACPHRLANIPPPTESKGEDSSDLFPLSNRYRFWSSSFIAFYGCRSMRETIIWHRVMSALLSALAFSSSRCRWTLTSSTLAWNLSSWGDPRAPASSAPSTIPTTWHDPPPSSLLQVLLYGSLTNYCFCFASVWISEYWNHVFVLFSPLCVK